MSHPFEFSTNSVWNRVEVEDLYLKRLEAQESRMQKASNPSLQGFPGFHEWSFWVCLPSCPFSTKLPTTSKPFLRNRSILIRFFTPLLTQKKRCHGIRTSFCAAVPKRSPKLPCRFSVELGGREGNHPFQKQHENRSLSLINRIKGIVI